MTIMKLVVALTADPGADSAGTSGYQFSVFDKSTLFYFIETFLAECNNEFPRSAILANQTLTLIK